MSGCGVRQGAFGPDDFSPTEGRTILQGIRGLLDGSLEFGDNAASSPPVDAKEGSPGNEEQPEVEVVFKKGIRVDGTNEKDRDAALSEVSMMRCFVACAAAISVVQQ